MEEWSVHSVSFRALQVLEVVRPQDLVVSEVVLSLHTEEGPAPDLQLFLQADQSADIFVVGPDVVQEGDHSLAVDGCLNAEVSAVKSVLAQPNKLISAV